VTIFLRTRFPSSSVCACRVAAALMLGTSPAVAATSGYEVDPLTGEPAYGHVEGARPPGAQPAERQLVAYSGPYARGTVVVSTSERRLYYVLGHGEGAILYVVGVARPGLEWSGVMRISRKRKWPAWRPPAQMLQRRPDLPRFMTGGLDNPLGARAMYLGASLYRIHGTNEPESIGQAVSSGCIRMNNEDAIDLYDRVRVGTKVVVLP
jgi:lipoprotein-anchoring transpeptidase ErfK/SrfK